MSISAFLAARATVALFLDVLDEFVFLFLVTNQRSFLGLQSFVLALQVIVNYPALLGLTASLRPGLPASMTRFAGTESVPTGSAVSAGRSKGASRLS